MTNDDNINISRRRVLGTLGAVGVGAAASGLGTTAFLNDTESFTGNTTTAGILDLKVDWQQHYFGPDGPVFVNAHPDHDGDGEQSIDLGDGEVASYSDEGRNIVDALTCETAGFDDDYDYTAPGRPDEMGGPIEEQASLIALDDVKPGDSGEITFSLHLCSNPGYIWMGGSEASNSENGYAEPEPTTEDGGDVLDPGDPVGRGELAESIEVELWYDDDCDNVRDGGEEADIVFTLDASGSMFYDQYGGVVSDESIFVDGENRNETTKIDLVERGVRQFLEALVDAGGDADVTVGIVFFDGFDPDDGTLDAPQTDLYPLQTPSSLLGSLGNFRDVVSDLTGGSDDPFDAGSVSTGTALEPAIEQAQAELTANGRSGVQAVNVVFTDGEPWRGGNLQSSYYNGVSDAAADARMSTPTPPTDVYVIGDETSVSAAQALVLDMAGPAGSPGGDESHLFDLTDDTSIPRLFQQVAQLFLPEDLAFSGTLAELFTQLESGDGIPLDANRFVDERTAYLPEITQCVAFSWELPVEVGNEVQGDGVAFDLGFYAEQARHNELADTGL